MFLRTLEGEGFEPACLVWVHAQESALAENLEMASRGVTISLDAIGTSDDLEMLDRIEALAEAGRQVVLSSDSTFVVHPPEPRLPARTSPISIGGSPHWSRRVVAPISPTRYGETT